jgi:hypothetical protein
VTKLKNIFEIGITLDKILRKLEAIDTKINSLPQIQVQVSNRFLPTYAALTKLGSATASQLSSVTGRTRALESKNLNEMYATGLLEKKRQGKNQVFIPKQPSFMAAKKLAIKPEPAQVIFENI